jgi:predicted pyridoxine 5'-phosphate oxidase superfamily flavin-nucleotide-binding protein
MIHKYLEIASTETVKAARRRYGGPARYETLDGTLSRGGPVRNDRLGATEIAFIAERDGFYVASVSETGWPYVQFRGGSPGFLRVLGERLLGFADFRGNQQYLTVGNAVANDRVSLFLMDYANRRRLKVFGRLRVVDAADDPELSESLTVAGYQARVERSMQVEVEAFDWNCPQHITPRFTQAELNDALAPIVGELRTLRSENERLREGSGIGEGATK